MNIFAVVQSKTILVVCLLLFCFTLQVRGASKDVILSKLERARAELLISQATEQRITTDFEELKASGQATPEIIKDYEIYLSRVQDMVKENQNLVDTLEAAHLKHRGPAQGTRCSKTPKQGSTLPSAGVVEETPDGRSLTPVRRSDTFSVTCGRHSLNQQHLTPLLSPITCS